MCRLEPVSVTYRTGLPHAETEIGKWPAETGAAKPPVQDRKSGNCRPETRAYPPNRRKCRGFFHTRDLHRRDRSGWLGREDSNLRMAESKSAALPLGYAPSALAARRSRPDDSGGDMRDQRRLPRNAGSNAHFSHFSRQSGARLAGIAPACGRPGPEAI